IHASETGTNSTANATLSGSNALSYASNAPYTSIVNNTMQLMTSVKRICIYTNGDGSGLSVGSGAMGVVCKSFSAKYR
ncbi:MAG: hypothetical protein IIU76_04675, partial [Bacteroidales bacterium]|nr:hypothetical protein [Bacteroidales bacterium]